MKKKTLKFTYAQGRRREASARVRLFKGKGESTVNGKGVYEYFPGEIAKKALAKPFEVTETSGKFYFSAKVAGGGKNGQLDAVVLGISRALVKISTQKHKRPLRKQNLLTRDSRVRQRRMVGMGGKARRQKQSPKR